MGTAISRHLNKAQDVGVVSCLRDDTNAADVVRRADRRVALISVRSFC